MHEHSSSTNKDANMSGDGVAERSVRVLLDALTDARDRVTYVRDTYGAGVFYRAFATTDEARAFIDAPEITDAVTYKADGDERACGPVAVGALTANEDDIVVVVDVKETDTRVTASTSMEPIVQRVELVPVEVAVESLPEQVPDNDPTCERVETAVRARLRRDNDTRRLIFYIDSLVVDSLDDADEFDAIDEDAFEPLIERLSSIVDERTNKPVASPAIFRQVAHEFRHHNAETHVVMWLKYNATNDVVWLAERVIEPSDES